MNLVYRRITYIIFFIIFLAAAPAVILYTQGYRYNFHHQRIQKIGILIISSIPKRAEIYLNGKIIEDRNTPAKIEGLLPADYEIKLTKDGYHDWQKRLPVYENATTFAEDIILWKKEIPIKLDSTNVVDWKISPNKDKIAIISQTNQLISLDLNNGNISIISQLDDYQNLKIIGWSNTSKKIIIQADKNQIENYFIFSPNQTIASDPQQITNYNYQIIKWDLKNDNTIYGHNQNGLWRIDLFTQKREVIIDDNLDDFLIIDDDIFTYVDGNIYRRRFWESSNPELVEKINCDSCRFVNKDRNKIILLDKQNQKIFIIDPENKNKIIENQAKTINWLNNNTILFYNDWEIWIYELDKKDPDLVTRMGENISYAIWHTEGRHIIFATENKVRIIELDNRELKNVTELVNFDFLTHITTDKKGEILYLSGQLAGQDGIYQLTIK